MCSNSVSFGFVGVLQWLNLTGENMKNEGLTLNQLAERNTELVTEVEKLRTERDQLAAENVALKDACGGNGSYRNCPACTFSEYIEVPETPTTDRFVAGIKADGVEMFAKHCDDSIGLVEPEDEELYTLMEEQAREFAKQLREGVNYV